MDAKLARIAAALDMAVQAHEGQRRGHGRGAPFINHVADVARRVGASPRADEATLIAALLHDVAEKTTRTLSDIEAAFGGEVAGVVAELTDDPGLSKAEQRRRQVEHAPRLSEHAKRVKLADKSSKLASIAEAPPPWWRRDRARREVRWARDVVAGLRGVDEVLEADFDRELARAEAAVGGL
jgi:guanosine-3',5'-bis(diphosphate) 3'-pyrophosphohydrolase